MKCIYIYSSFAPSLRNQIRRWRSTHREQKTLCGPSEKDLDMPQTLITQGSPAESFQLGECVLLYCSGVVFHNNGDEGHVKKQRFQN